MRMCSAQTQANIYTHSLHPNIFVKLVLFYDSNQFSKFMLSKTKKTIDLKRLKFQIQIL